MKPAMPSKSGSNPVRQESTQYILRLAREQPQLGQAAVAQQLQQAGIQISASGVRYIWKKYGLETTTKRLQALNASTAGNSLSKSQQHLLDRKLRKQNLHQADQAEAAVSEGAHGESSRRAIILKTAAELFAEHGFDRTTMRDIASQAGLLPGSVYHHFTSKAELFLITHQEGFNQVIKQVKAAADKGIDPWDSLTRAFSVHITCMVGESLPLQRLAGQGLAMSDHPELRGQLKPYRQAYEDFIRQLIDDLPLPDGTDRTLLRLTLLGAGNWVFVWYREGGKTLQEIAQDMVAMLRHGVEV